MKPHTHTKRMQHENRIGTVRTYKTTIAERRLNSFTHAKLYH